MVKTTKCVYCGSDGVISTEIIGHVTGFGFQGFFKHERSHTKSLRRLNGDCPLCNKKYVCIIGTYTKYIKKHVNFTDESLNDFKRIFPNVKKFNIVFKNVIAIARLYKKLQRLRPYDYDITFKLSGKMAYLHCIKKACNYLRNETFIVVSVHEV